MATFPLATLAATVLPTGISAPPYSDIYESLQASFKAIYGTDAYIPADSQDGQMLAIFARAISDANDAAIAVFNSFSPSTAQGRALSSNVKINGISRAVATKSSALVRLVGQIGATITDGVVSDDDGNRWDIPSPTVIPPAGFIDVTATAQVAGAISAEIGEINRIVNPQLGWQSVSNTAVAAIGAPIETDAALRRRQTVSTALPSQTVLDGINGAVAAVAGVTQVVVYENDTDAVDANGLPEHSIAVVVLGGSSTDIANAILLKKTPGAFTYGTTVVVVNDAHGIPYNIRYFIPTAVPLSVAITVKALPGYTTAIGNQIKQALVDYINGLGIGKRSDLGKLYLPAQFYGGVGSTTFEVDVLQQAIKPATPTAADVAIAFNERATLLLADVALTVV